MFFWRYLGILVQMAPENDTAFSRFGKTVSLTLLENSVLLSFSVWDLMKFLCVFSYEYNLLFSTSVQSVCKFLCFLSQEQNRKILTRKKRLEAETKQILFHPIDGGNTQNTRETSLLTWNLKKALVKQATFFRKKKKKVFSCFLASIFW